MSRQVVRTGLDFDRPLPLTQQGLRLLLLLSESLKPWWHTLQPQARDGIRIPCVGIFEVASRAVLAMCQLHGGLFAGGPS